MIMGHESSGVVSKVGSDVKHLKVGIELQSSQVCRQDTVTHTSQVSMSCALV